MVSCTLACPHEQSTSAAHFAKPWLSFLSILLVSVMKRPRPSSTGCSHVALASTSCVSPRNKGVRAQKLRASPTSGPIQPSGAWWPSTVEATSWTCALSLSSSSVYARGTSELNQYGSPSLSVLYSAPPDPGSLSQLDSLT